MFGIDDLTEKLKQYRSEIDEVDQQLINCLAARIRISQSIGALKLETQVQVYQHDRATAVKDRYATLGLAQGLQPEFMVNLFQLIHQESCRIQGKLHPDH